MNMKVVLAATMILVAGLYIGYRYHISEPEIKKTTPEERIALQKQMTIKEIYEQKDFGEQIWRDILQETSLYDQLAGADRSFILFLVPDEFMVAPLIATQGAKDNLLEKWRALPLDKKIEIAKNYIIKTDAPWRPEVGTENFTTLGGKKISITTAPFETNNKSVTSVNTKRITVNGISDIGIVHARNGIIVIMPELIWENDIAILSH